MSRFTTRQSLTSWDVAALRYAGSFVCVLPLLAWRGLPRIPPPQVAAVLVFAGLGFPILAYLGYRFAPAAHGATVMAAGLPVVATRWRELERLQSPAALCESSEQFVAAIEGAVACQPDQELYRAYAEQADWKHRVVRLLQLAQAG